MVENITIEMQVANVLAGKTASGAPRGNPIPFPAHEFKRALLIRWADAFPNAADHVRTAYIRKLAHYLVRLSLPLRTTDVIDGMTWFIDHPEHVGSRLSFAGAVRRAREAFAQKCREAETEQREALLREMSEPMPPPPVLYQHGAVALHEVVHPKQMMTVGIAGMNCLARGQGGHYRCNARYWSLVSRKLLRVLALWDGDRLLCVFSVADDMLREWQYAAHPAEVLPVLPACLAELTKSTGPLNTDHAPIVFDGTCFDIHQEESAVIRRALGAHHARI